MMVFSAHEAADLTGIPYRTLIDYFRRWPWLVWKDEDREISERTQGRPQLYVPRGTCTVLALINTCYEVGLVTRQVADILAALPERLAVLDGEVRGELVYYPQTRRTEQMDLQMAADKLAGQKTARDFLADDFRASIALVKGTGADRARADLEEQAAEVERAYTLPIPGQLSIILPMGALQGQLHAREAEAGICPRNVPIDLSNRITATLQAQYRGDQSA